MARCSGCGQDIQFIVNEETGNLVPVQRIKKVYYEENGKLHHHMDMKSWHGKPLWLSHFETCSKANDFSRSRKG